MKKKVTEADILEMKSLRKQGMTYREIAEKFGVHNTTVGKYCDAFPSKRPPAPTKKIEAFDIPTISVGSTKKVVLLITEPQNIKSILGDLWE